jgi:hypothetical protein
MKLVLVQRLFRLFHLSIPKCMAIRHRAFSSALLLLGRLAARYPPGWAGRWLPEDEAAISDARLRRQLVIIPSARQNHFPRHEAGNVVSEFGVKTDDYWMRIELDPGNCSTHRDPINILGV